MLFFRNSGRLYSRPEDGFRYGKPVRQLRVKKFLYTICLTVCSAMLYLSAQAQRITLKEKNASLEKVLVKIKHQTSCDVFYTAKFIKEAKPVTIEISDMPLRTALDMIFKGQSFTYSIANNTIVLTERKIQPDGPIYFFPGPPANVGRDSLIHGEVTDSSGNPVQAATVLNLDEKDNYTLSNADGTFALFGHTGSILKITAVGYNDKTVRYAGEKKLCITLEDKVAALTGIQVETYRPEKRDPTTSIDMTMRHYMNLGQLLQGTVPGLSLQTVATSQKTLTAINVSGQHVNGNEYYGTVRYSVDEFLQSQYASAYNDILAGKTQSNYTGGVIFSPIYNYSTSNAQVPQLRGANAFGVGTNGMLVVIDGFPQDNFPADYPMTNVESVQVIKDPAELIKWGPKAAGGIILITTNRAKSGRLQTNYSSNFYYIPAPRFSRSKMQLASSADILSYLKDAYDSSNFLPSYSANGLGQNVATGLLSRLKNGTISQDYFNEQWDSLGRISNESQLRLLQQNAFNQNHMLTLSGGNEHYRFTAAGTYNNTQSNNLNNYNHTYGLNLNNDISLLNKKLRIQWLLNLSSSRAREGASFDPGALQPYQLLLNPDGSYVYDYSSLSPQADSIIEKAGYKNYGVNLLQDARVNSNISQTFQTRSRVNVNWEILPGLSWSSSFLYDIDNVRTRNLEDAASSAARQLVDNYGAPTPGGVDFYVPPGGILQKSSTDEHDWNLRSALSYSRTFGRHRISASVGGGGYSTVSNTPTYSTIYGYNSLTGTGSPVFLPASDPNGSIYNFYSLIPGSTSSSIYPYTLLTAQTGDSTISRGINWNGSLAYAYNERLILSGMYNASYSPNYGRKQPYSKLSNYTGDATWKAVKFKDNGTRLLSSVSVSAGITGTLMPTLPAQISAYRYLQSSWNNYTIWVNGYTASEQSGQTSQNLYQKLSLGFDKEHLILSAAYNTQHIKGSIQKDSASVYTDSTLHYVSADISANFRKNLLRGNISYSRSPEGQSQLNGNLSYNIGKETYFHSSVISTLLADVTLQNISAYQALGIMMGTNAPAAGGGFSLATNNNFSTLPPKNINIEAHTSLGFLKDRYTLDLRYYNRTTSGLNNNVPVVTDPSSGLSSQTTYSEIVNKGVEFYLQTKVVQERRFSYTVTLNGAYNVNVAKEVPHTDFYAASGYNTAYRNGYSINNLWSYKWAGLDAHGNPQIYNSKGQIVANPDSATLASSLVYSGVTRAPWTGGLIQEWTLGDFFARVAVTFNLGAVMRSYIPSPSGTLDNSILIRDRWRAPGDEEHTDVPAMALDGGPGTIRTLITQNSTNSIMSADNIRLQEVMVGWSAPKQLLSGWFAKSLIFTMQVENAALWTRNKLHVDPNTVSDNGTIGLPVPTEYSCSVNVNF